MFLGTRGKVDVTETSPRKSTVSACLAAHVPFHTQNRATPIYFSQFLGESVV